MGLGNATVKRATKKAFNLFFKTSLKAVLRLLLPVSKSILQQIRLVVARTLRHLQQNNFALGPIKYATCTDFVVKSRTNLYFLQQLFAACNNLRFVARQV